MIATKQQKRFNASMNSSHLFVENTAVCDELCAAAVLNLGIWGKIKQLKTENVDGIKEVSVG